jgi:general nucleoside transport system ATP-binding protein
VSVLSLHHISKRFGSLQANDAISLSVGAGEVLALLGENGAGKSTLMNILFGHYVADSGTIEVDGAPLPAGKPQAALHAGIGMVHQHFTLAENLSVIDNILLGSEPLTRIFSGRAAALAKVTGLARQFGLQIAPNALVRTLSVGEKQRVEILKVLYRGARILILDEPTSVLTPQEVATLFATLKALVAQGLSIIFISHKLDEVLAVADRVAVLRQGKLVHAQATQGATRAQLARAMVGRDVRLPVREVPAGSGQALLQLDQLRTAGTPPIADVTMQVHAGEIVGIAGVSGNGQATLAEVLCGARAWQRGTLTVNATSPRATARAFIHAGVARIPEDRQHVGSVGDLSVWENAVLTRFRSARFSKWGVLRGAAARAEAQALVTQFDVRLSSIEQAIRKLSGGNMQKLILGRELAGAPSVIIAEQPTWGLDVGAVAFVRAQLLQARARGAAIVLISEDLEELFALSDRIAVMSKGHLSAALPVERWSTEAIGLAMAGGARMESEHAH